MAASNQHRACPRLLASHSKHVFFFFFRYVCIHVYVDVQLVQARKFIASQQDTSKPSSVSIAKSGWNLEKIELIN